MYCEFSDKQPSQLCRRGLEKFPFINRKLPNELVRECLSEI